MDTMGGAIDVDNMEAGPLMDALVAELVLGWTGCVERVGAKRTLKTTQELGSNMVTCRPPNSKRNHLLPRYSNDIASAFEVLQPFDEWHLEKGSIHDTITCTIHHYSNGVHDGWGSSTALPLVICRAALKAVIKLPD